MSVGLRPIATSRMIARTDTPMIVTSEVYHICRRLVWIEVSDMRETGGTKMGVPIRIYRNDRRRT